MAKAKNFSMANTMAFGSLKGSDITSSTRPTHVESENVSALRVDTLQTNNQPKDAPITPSVTEKTKCNTGDTLKTTSISIHRKSLNYLAYMAKLSSCNQNIYLTQLLSEEKEHSVATIPNFDTVKGKRDTVDVVVKGIKLPEDILAWTKAKAASEMKSISEYIDDLLMDRLSAVK